MLKAKKYYVGNHEDNGLLLHCEGCNLIPESIKRRRFIGTCYTVNQAMTVALVHHRDVKRCPACLQVQGKDYL